ncbi:WYL domain-containing protein [Motilimonas sp. E26]|uniref:WYL domain-containing protein n=1 Tax=Motilimonas sp. E26 TaxID=2865674 RepID=UPI001E420882|nr:WYL domain-containing protein [Motilimonas sp. E26]MCE0555466.1 WYL domain-containing protein [Motilimonas sp. E26]
MNNHVNDWPYKFDLLTRFRFIEIITLWEGRLITNHLQMAFGIGRQQASKIINTYIEQVSHSNLVYDANQKGYCPSNTFQPKLTQGTASEYLNLIRQNEELSVTFERLNIVVPNIECLAPPLRNIEPSMLQRLVKACRNQECIEVDYASLQQPENTDGRLICPHTLVFTGMRWHVRAWCEQSKRFSDFVLSRFRSVADVEGHASKTIESDSLWNESTQLVIIPDPRLTPEQQHIIATDYGMSQAKLIVPLRKALVNYALQLYRLNSIHQDPLVQQIVVEPACRQIIKQWEW